MAVKQNSLKIGLLESGQQEIINQVWLLFEKFGKKTLQNDDGVHSSKQDKINLKKPITHKEMTEILAKARTDSTLKKKGSAPKYPPEMDLDPFLLKYQQAKSQCYSGTSSAYPNPCQHHCWMCKAGG